MHFVQVCRHRSLLSFFCYSVLFEVLLISMYSFGQMGPNLDEGLKPFGSFHGGNLDTVSMTSGNVTVHIPVASYPQRGGKLDQDFYLRMNSKGWQAVIRLDAHNNPVGYRWLTPAGRGAGPNTAIVNSHDIVLHRLRREEWSCDTLTSSEGFAYRIETADGASHWLSRISDNGTVAQYRSVDGSGFRLDVTLDPSDAFGDVPVVTDRSGVRYSFITPWQNTHYEDPAGAGFCPPRILHYTDWANVAKITDSNGNTITGSGTQTTDTLGRQIATTQTSPTDTTQCQNPASVSRTDLIAFPGPAEASGVSKVKVCYMPVALSTAFNQPNTEEYPASIRPGDPGPLLPPISTVVLPNGTKWSFSYDSYGNVSQIVFPTGGTISYTWITQPSCSDDNQTKMSRFLATRTVNPNDGTGPKTWTYAWGDTSAGLDVVNKVMDPQQNEIDYTASNFGGCSYFETSRTVKQFDAVTGTLSVVQNVTTQYDHNTVNIDGQQDVAANVVPTVITTSYPNGKTTQTVNEYDCSPNFPCANPSTTPPFRFGNLMQQDTYDFGDNAPGALLRSAVTHYQWEADASYLVSNLIDLPTSNDTFDVAPPANVRPHQSSCPSVGAAAGPVPKQESCFHYDQYASNPLSDPQITKGHEAPLNEPYRGNQTSVDRWLNLPVEKTITTKTSFANTGVVTDSYDALSHHTGFQYSPTFYGAYVTKITDPAGLTTTKDYDFNTGLTRSITDPNGHTTSFGYDSSARLSTKTLPATAAGVGVTSLTYRDFSPFGVNVSTSVTSAINMTAEADVDGLGRLRVSRLTSDPDGTTYTRTLYDNLGRKHQEWNASRCDLDVNPSSCTGETTFGFSQYVYDALGRTTTVIPQDGSAASNNVSTDYSNFPSVTVTDEQKKLRRTRSDALGRIVEADEPSSGATIPAKQGTGYVDFGELPPHSKLVGAAPAVAAWGTVQIGGTEGVKFINQSYCAQYDRFGRCLDTETTTTEFDDSGTVVISVNGTTCRKSVPYGSGSNASGLAAALASQFHNDPSCLVDGAYDGNTGVILTARVPGSNGNTYVLTASTSTNDPSHFPNGSFSATVTAGFAHGVDANPGQTVNDTGTLYITVNQLQKTVPYDGSSTIASLMSQFKTKFDSDPARTFTTDISGSRLQFTSIAYGTGTNAYGLAVNVTSGQQATFASPTYTLAPSGTTFTGGANDQTGSVGTLDAPYVTLYTYDVLGNLICVEQHGDATGTGCGAAQSSDSTSAWRIRRFTYDSLGRLLTAKNPESGLISYTYDDDGNVVTKASPAANDHTGTAIITITYSYDVDHRNYLKTYSNGDPAVRYFFDQTSFNGLIIANGFGRRTGMCDNYSVSAQTCNPANQAAWSYDQIGRPLTERRTIAGITKSVTYAYNLDDSVASITYPSGRTVTYTPTGAGRTQSAADLTNNITYASQAHYAPSGALTSLLQGANISVANSFNNRLQPQRLQATASGASIFDLSYNFNAGSGNNGNVMQIINNRDASRSTTFTYDDLNRIKTAETASTWGNSYVYDAWGNFYQMNLTKGTANSWQGVLPTVRNQMDAYCYDSAGNMTNQGACGPNGTYTYDGENRISSAGGVTYTYDGDGERTQKSSGTIYWRGMLSDPLAETDMAGNTVAEYIFFNGKRLARWDSSGVHYYFADHLGSTSVVTSAAGSREVENDYTPFGGTRTVQAGSNHYLFTGKERDGESGFDNFGVRYYASTIGRFVTPDEFWKDARPNDPQSWNLYAYVRNNPLRYVDPTGESTSSCVSDGDGCAYTDGSGYAGDTDDGSRTPAEYQQNRAQAQSQAQAQAQVQGTITVTTDSKVPNPSGLEFPYCCGIGPSDSSGFGWFYNVLVTGTLTEGADASQYSIVQTVDDKTTIKTEDGSFRVPNDRKTPETIAPNHIGPNREGSTTKGNVIYAIDNPGVNSTYKGSAVRSAKSTMHFTTWVVDKNGSRVSTPVKWWVKINVSNEHATISAGMGR